MPALAMRVPDRLKALQRCAREVDGEGKRKRKGKMNGWQWRNKDIESRCEHFAGVEEAGCGACECVGDR